MANRANIGISKKFMWSGPHNAVQQIYIMDNGINHGYFGDAEILYYVVIW